MKHAKYLFANWGGVRKDLRGKFIYLFLDYDGTLSPIARAPDEAIIPKRTKDALRQLSRVSNCKIAIVSGRALGDISKRVGLKNIIYVGNHGFEIRGPKISFKSPLPIRYRRTLDEIKAKLEKNLSSIKGVFIEDKGFSLSVHYRLADKKNTPAVEAECYGAILPYELKNNVRVKTGKMVLEIRPPMPWDKGKVILWLLGRLSAILDRKMKILPIYVGDDATDEDAFESLSNRSITIFVGKPNNTKARFYLKDTKEVKKFLEIILENMSSGAPWQKKK